jgi:hypothetical protein
MLAAATATIARKIIHLQHPNRDVVRAMKSIDHDQHLDVIQLEIGLDKLETLIEKGELCAADVRCLNSASKECIWNLCLCVCARRLQCNIASSTLHECCKQHADNLNKDSLLAIGLKREYLVHL